MLTLMNLSVSVGEKKILDQINYRFKKNKIYVIMGPNGSGKSTLAHAIMGNNQFSISKETRVLLGKQDISGLSSDKRAKKGIFISYQSPVSLSGISIFQLIRTVLGGKQDVLKIKTKMEQFAKELQIHKDLTERSFNEGASGGEKKKLEILQAAMLQPKLAIFDEVDTGVDIDALKLIFLLLKRIRKTNTYIFITHNGKLLSHLKPDVVLIMKEGKLVQEGNAGLIRYIDIHGYENIEKKIH